MVSLEELEKDLLTARDALVEAKKERDFLREGLREIKEETYSVQDSEDIRALINIILRQTTGRH